MTFNPLSMTTDLKPEITVKSRDKENYSDALFKSKTALYEKMHNIIDYYCEQIKLLDTSSIQEENQNMEPKQFWNELQRYATIHFEEKTTIFKKFYGANDFDCYCVLLNYDHMQLPWPDGYKDPSSRIGGMAPMGLNDNYFFYAEGNILYRLDFGTCDHKEIRLPDGSAYNKLLEPVAVANHEIGKYLPGVNHMKEAFEKLIKAKHGDGPVDTLSVMEILESFSQLLRSTPELQEYSLQILNSIDSTDSNFPQRFAIYKGNEPIYLEAFFDNIRF
ncbi:MAG: hypothetical protein PUD93_06200 [Lachnospiraceae bacterium]|nr:hypothetical protein [Lachnospiraceae bacterium]